MNLPVTELSRLVWSQLWQVTALALAVWIAVRVLARQRPHLGYLLWMLVIVKCLTPPVWSSPLGVFGLASIREPARGAAAPPELGHNGDPRPLPRHSGLQADRKGFDTVETPTARVTVEQVRIPADPRTSERVQPAAPRSLDPAYWLLAAWLIGAAAVAARIACQWIRIRRMLCRAVADDARADEMLRSLAARLSIGRIPQIVLVRESAVPAVFGVLRPRILLPQIMLNPVHNIDLEPILAHELIHVRRWDTLAGRLQLVAQVLWWFHPLVWRANREARQAREHCCDEAVISGLGYPPLRYARSLLAVSEYAGAAHAAVGVPAISSLEATSSRMEQIMRRSPKFRKKTPFAYYVVAVILGALLLPGAESPARRLAAAKDADRGPERKEKPGESTLAAESLADDPARQEGHLTIFGTVVMPDGSPAADAVIESSGNRERFATIRTDRRGRFKLSGEFVFDLMLHARSRDDTYQTTASVSKILARARRGKPVDLRLAPAREVVVTVRSSGKPVEEAQVVAIGPGYNVNKTTGANGAATLRIPSDAKFHSLVAWHPRQGMVAKIAPQGADRGLSEQTFQLSLLAPGPRSFRVIDVDGRPVPNLKFGVNVAVGLAGWITLRDIDEAQLVTDARGEATAPWYPREGLKYVDVRIDDAGWKLDGIGANTDPNDDGEAAKMPEKGLLTIHVRRKISVKGRLKMPDGASAEGILVTGFGFGAQQYGDVPAARALADGSFDLTVASGYGYGLNIGDVEWASDGWNGLILRDDAATPARITLDVYPATPLNIRVTQGPQHESVANAWVRIKTTTRPFQWNDDQGKRQHARGGTSFQLPTDANGTLLVGVGKGKNELSLSAGSWHEERAIEVSDDTAQTVEFHRPWLEKRTVTGRLLWNNSRYIPSPKTVIRTETKNSRDSKVAVAQTKIRPDGTFKIEVDAGDVSVFVFDVVRGLSGFARIGPVAETVDAPLSPASVFGGAVMDEKGQPLAGATLRLFDDETRFRAAEDQITDERGRFRFDAVATNVRLYLEIRRQPAGPIVEYYRPRSFQPGETRDDIVLTVESRDLALEKSDVPTLALADRAARAIRDAGLTGTHALIVLQGDSSKEVARLAEEMIDPAELDEIYGFLPMLVRSNVVESDSATLKRLDWQRPVAGEVVLVAVAGDGKQIATQKIAAADHDAAVTLYAAFVRRHVPPVPDAQARLAAAQDEAKRTGRRLLIVEGGPQCGPCLDLAEWMDDQHALLEKDYVILKILAGRDHHAMEVMKQLNQPPKVGIPWMAITEPDGAVLVTSDGPLGNIGLPSSAEDIQYFREMLNRTTRRLKAEEVDRLAQSLVKPSR
jgi:beta-lactamase regulating signal transducer with metallopeptidase domain